VPFFLITDLYLVLFHKPDLTGWSNRAHYEIIANDKSQLKALITRMFFWSVLRVISIKPNKIIIFNKIDNVTGFDHTDQTTNNDSADELQYFKFKQKLPSFYPLLAVKL